MAGPKRPGGPTILIWEGPRHAPLAAARVRDDDNQLAGLSTKLDVAFAAFPCSTLFERFAKLCKDIGDCRRTVTDPFEHALGEIAKQGVESIVIRQFQGEDEVMIAHPRSYSDR